MYPIEDLLSISKETQFQKNQKFDIFQKMINSAKLIKCLRCGEVQGKDKELIHCNFCEKKNMLGEMY